MSSFCLPGAFLQRLISQFASGTFHISEGEFESSADREIMPLNQDGWTVCLDCLWISRHFEAGHRLLAG